MNALSFCTTAFSQALIILFFMLSLPRLFGRDMIKQWMCSMKLKIATACLLASANVFSAENQLIAGLNYTTSIFAEMEVNFDELDRTITEDLDISTVGVYLGYISEKNNRFLFSYSSATVDFDDSNISEDVTGFDLDWQFVYGEEQIQPYWGIGFGFHSIDDATILRNSNKDGDSLSGASFQMMVGIKLPINEQVELDVSFQRKAYAWQSIEITNGFFTETIDTNYVQNALNFGAGFKF